MSLKPNFIQYQTTDVMRADHFVAPDPFFPPDLQLAYAPSPDTFDLEFDNDKELEEIDLEVSFKQMDDFFAAFRDTVPEVPTFSAVTHSTESAYDVPSLCSCDPTLSEYSIPSEIESHGSVNDGLYSAHASVYSAAFSDSPPSFSSPSPAEAVAVQESAAFALPAAVHVVPGEAQEAHGPVKPFKCPYPRCRFSSARKHNLKTHIGTHNKKESKRFPCTDCEGSFTRKHDLQRHRATLHRELKSSPSVSSVPKVHFDPLPDLPELSHHYNTLIGDPMPMLSPYPDLETAIDVPEDIIAWLLTV